MDSVIVLVGVRGDPGYLSRQMSAQIKNWKKDRRRILVMCGPFFGSQPLACTMKEYPKKHPDEGVIHFMLDAIRNPTIDVYLVPARIDKLIMTNFRENSKFICGSTRQKSSFGRTLSTNIKEIQEVMHGSLRSPV